MTVDLEPVAEILEDKLRTFVNQVGEAQAVTATEVLNTGELSKEGRDYYLDECMFNITWLGEQYEIACEEAGIELPDGYISDMEQRLINRTSEILEEIILKYGEA